MKLRYYQSEKMVVPAINAIESGKKNILIVAPTGAGKTAVLVWWANEAYKRGKRILIVVHKETIMKQFMSTCHAFGLPYAHIASGSPILNSTIQIAMVGTLVNKLERIPATDWILNDECLTGNSKIKTSTGIKKIKNINIGDYVLSSDLKYHRVYNKIIKSSKKLYSIKTIDGKKIKCTSNHKVMTMEGWKYASDINSFDMVQSIMYTNNYEKEKISLHDLQQRIRRAIQWSIPEKTSLLFYGMFKDLQKQNFIRNDGKNKQKVRFRENEEKQSYEKSRDTGKGENHIKSNGSQTENTRRKWKRSNYSPISDSKCFRVGYGNSGKNKNGKRFRISNLLQNRCSERSIKNSNRSRWKLSLCFVKARARQKERCVLNWSRVESVALLEQGNRKGFRFLRSESTVYDLSVEDKHDYFANNILVHNCHHLGVSNQWGKITHHFRDRNKNLKTIGVSATPNGLTSGRGLHPFFDTIIDGLSIEYLVSEGWLAFPHTMTGQKIDMPKIKKVNGEYDKNQQFAEHWSKKEIIGEYIDKYKEYGDGLPYIVACSGLKHAHHVQQEYEKYARQNGKSWKAVFIQGGKKHEKELYDAIAGMAKGTVQLLTFDSVFGEGVDVPYCCGVQWLRKTGSLVNWLQYNGRSLRPIWPEGFDQYNSTVGERLEAISKSVKPVARIQDFAGNFEEHGHPISNHPWTLADTRVKGKNQMATPQFSKCEKCLGVWPGKPSICPGILPNGSMCENPLNTEEKKKGRKPPKVIDGVLIDAGAGEDADELYKMMQKAAELQNMSEADRRNYIISMVHRGGTNMETKKMAEVLGYEISGKWTDKIYKRVRKKHD